MCGIYASVSISGFRQPSEAAKQLLCNRGPDHIGELHTQLTLRHEEPLSISLISTVLALRGGHVTAQPFKDDLSGSSLCWNGEAWRLGLDPVHGNDGQAVFKALVRASFAQATSTSSDSIAQVLRSIAGPFAFVFLDKINHQIYFGRDRLGRRSLLRKCDGDLTSLELSSVADPDSGPWSEVEADGIYQISCAEKRSIEPQQNPKSSLISKSFAPIYVHQWNDISSEVSPVNLGTFNMAAKPVGTCTLGLEAESVTQLKKCLTESLAVRILNIPLPPDYETEHQVRMAILFSGGLDCTVLARMSHDILPPKQHIDLINVAFENPRVVQAARNVKHLKKREEENNTINTEHADQYAVSDEDNPYEKCPDRQTGRKAFQELQKACPSRSWRFIAIDIPYAETIAHRTNVINLIHPHNTEMDLSIAFALYFAARGSGQAISSMYQRPLPYTTRARVLLSGLGADELFGGYTRHATAFSRTGYEGLLSELKLDIDRLGQRNLGRDDRVISAWGREARFPYLDEALVKWAVECPIWEKTGFDVGEKEARQMPEIEPGKKVLRLLAYLLGMHSVATEKKRAIQFGARTAKMDAGKTKGTNLIS